MEGNQLKIVGVIPARYNSSRFPGKPLALILGKPMIQWVYESVSKCRLLDSVIVATDNHKIMDAVTQFGGSVVMTGDCECGTDRVYEAVKTIDCDIVLNIQGDEPLVDDGAIKDIIRAFDDPEVYAAILRKKIDSDLASNPNICKVVIDEKQFALYFSRFAIPYKRERNTDHDYYMAMGIYGFKKDFLSVFTKLPVGNLERDEKLEPLRILENGFKIKTVESSYEGIGVDTPEDILYVESKLRGKNNG